MRDVWGPHKEEEVPTTAYTPSPGLPSGPCWVLRLPQAEWGRMRGTRRLMLPLEGEQLTPPNANLTKCTWQEGAGRGKDGFFGSHPNPSLCDQWSDRALALGGCRLPSLKPTSKPAPDTGLKLPLWGLCLRKASLDYSAQVCLSLFRGLSPWIQSGQGITPHLLTQCAFTGLPTFLFSNHASFSCSWTFSRGISDAKNTFFPKSLHGSAFLVYQIST